MQHPKEISVPTYFIDTSINSSSLMYLKRKGFKFNENLIFLGRSGIVQIMNYNIAFLSGIDSNPYKEIELRIKDFDQVLTLNNFYQNDIETLISESLEKQIDIFISGNWPYKINQGLGFNKSEIQLM